MVKKISILFYVLLMISCQQKEIKIETATKPLKSYHTQYQEDNVIAIFIASWSATGPLLKKAFEDKSIKNYLSKFDAIVLVYDCTKKESLGSKEVQRYGLKATPLAMVIKKPKGTEVWLRPSVKKEELLSQLKNEMEKP